MDLWDTVLFEIGGLPVYGYGAAVAAAALLFCSLLLIRARKNGLFAAAGACALSVFFGFVFSRLLYTVTDQVPLSHFSAEMLIRFDAGGFSMYGALLGAAAGCALAARWSGNGAPKLMDALAPCLMLFILIVRVAEWGGSLGLSRELTEERDPWLRETFLAADQDGYRYLRVYLLEAVAALILLIILLADRKRRPAGNVMLRAMLLYGAVQTLMESLRYDQHMKFGFVGVQHILSYAVLCLALVILILRRRRTEKKDRTAMTAAILILPAAGISVLLEFLIDRTSVSRYLLYAVYALLMGGMAGLGFTLLKRTEKEHISALKGNA